MNEQLFIEAMTIMLRAYAPGDTIKAFRQKVAEEARKEKSPTATKLVREIAHVSNAELQRVYDYTAKVYARMQQELSPE